MKKINLVVLMGGMSSEHEVSLSTGENVIKCLDKKKYNIKPVVINKKGEWLIDNKKTTIDEALKNVDVIFNAMHGEYGEDGRIQGLLDCLNISYTGSGVLASALGMDKIKSYRLFNLCGLVIPKYITLEKSESPFFYDRKKWGIIEKFKRIVIKPSCLGSSVGISIVDSKDEKKLKGAVDKAFKVCDEIIIEEYIDGQEMTCGIVENVKGQKYFALPVTEIIPPDDRFFDYEVKYDGSTQEITPARIDKKLAIRIQEVAKKAHQILGCSNYSRVDFIVKDNKIYVLEVNTLPGLTSESLLPKAAKEAGIEFSKLLDIIIKNARGPVV